MICRILLCLAVFLVLMHPLVSLSALLCEEQPPSTESEEETGEGSGEESEAGDPDEGGDGEEGGEGEEEEIEIGEVEVEAERVGEGLKDVPATIEVIDREEIEESGAGDLLDLLRRKVGMNESEIFGGTSIGLLGLPAKFTLVLIDGNRITGRVFEQLDFNQLPLSAVERIEVIKGPSSTLYGSAAIGGVINIITRKPPDGITGEVRLQAGSNGLLREGIGFGFGFENDGILLDVEHLGYDGFDLDPRTLDSDGDAENHVNVFLKWRHKFGASSRIEFTGLKFNETRTSVRFAPPDITREGTTRTRRLQLSLNYEWDVAPGRVLRLGVHDGSFDHSFTSHFVGFDESTATMTAFYEDSLDFEVGYTAYLDRHIIMAGVKRLYDEIESDRVAEGGAKYSTNVAYLEHEWALDAAWTLVWGARLDDNSEYGARLSPKVGFKYKHSEKLIVRGTVSRGFRAPGLKELFFDFNSPFGYRIEGNPDLLAETSTGYQLSVESRPGANDQLRLILFRNEVRNLIEAVEITKSPWLFREENIEDALSQGIELGWGHKLSEHWSLSYDALYTDATDEDTGLRLPNAPRWDHRASLNYARGAFNAEAFLRSKTSRFTDLANETEAPGFTTVDLHLGYEWHNFETRLHLLNMLDEVNRLFGPKPGFEWQAEALWYF